jgi:hypothetical protein
MTALLTNEAVDDGLSQLNPSAALSDKVRLGQEAMARQRRRFDDWLVIGEALDIGRSAVLRDIHSNQVSGPRFEKAMGAWLVANGFKEIDKGTRCRLLECLKHRKEIEQWRISLTDDERFRYNHPDVVLKKWKQSISVSAPNTPPKPSAVAKLKQSIIGLEEENARMRREIEHGGGDLWCRTDRPADIARVMLDTLGATKAESVAREILKSATVKTAKNK